jgi:hypothetical protein
MRVRSVLLYLAVLPLLVGAAAPIQLQPSSQWDLDYGENSCRLIRLMGEGKQQTKLVFESVGPGDLTMLAIGAPLYSPKFEPAVTAKFVPAQSNELKGTSAVGASGHDAAAFWSNLGYTNTVDEDVIARSNAIQVNVEGGHPVVLATGDLGPAMQAFDKCTQDLLADFGLDPAVQAKIARPASAPGLEQWLEGEVFFSGSQQQERISEASFRLLVDATGHVTKCVSVSRFNVPEFDVALCTAIEKGAPIQPAQLADGTKVPSYVVEHIDFELE